MVDDGSPDSTYAVAQQYAAREGCDRIRVLKLSKNRGKGGAVRRGMMMIRGQYALMVDADAATRISDVAVLERVALRVLSRHEFAWCLFVSFRSFSFLFFLLFF